MTATAPTGKCICGNITVTLSETKHDVGVCHCALCRHWNSGPWMALQDPAARIEGDSLTIFSSSSFAERGFCRDCGTHIFHRPKHGPELAISAGLFPSSENYVAREIFVDSKSKFYALQAASEQMTGLDMAREWLPKLVGRSIRRWLGR